MLWTTYGNEIIGGYNELQFDDAVDMPLYVHRIVVGNVALTCLISLVMVLQQYLNM